MPEKRKLLVVSNKDYEICTTYLKGLIETNDDKKDGDNVRIIGVEDGTVSVGTMTDKEYHDNKIKLSSAQKVLFIGDVQENKNLEPIMTTLYDKYGVKIGYFGNQMHVTTDMTALISMDSYKTFINEFRRRTYISSVKRERKIGLNWKTFLKVSSSALCWWTGPAFIIKDVFDDKNLIQEQQRLFAMLELYMNHLDKFMKA